ncbi:TRF2-interacting telomeric protein/Rap1 C terminal domain-containing protein [Annulohypoxylon moriforme]|nr:TRF2-interacting telomeric protein/Rap1 C terminal domain-containing protein [Annulohypoxylon moriforme]
MAAPIVYEGALAPKDRLHNGLFKNMKFWVAQRVPMRLTWIQKIQDNGGKVVPLEKDSDVLIADHLKKNCPPGSYSYKWIEDSLKAGSLQTREDYLCAPASQPQLANSAVPRKSTRAAFTPEEDKILTEWVMKKEREGESVGGYQIYKELEAKHPTHTYQSWHARWVKKLQYLARPELSDNEPPSPPTKQAAEQHAHPPPSIPKTPIPRRAGQTPTQSPTPRSRAKFTKEDDDILVECIQQCIRHNQPTRGIKIFRELANDFPQHTEQSWRDRWVKQLSAKYEKDIAHWKSSNVREETPETQDLPLAQESTNIKTSTPQKPHTRSKGPSQSIIPKRDDRVESENGSSERHPESEIRAIPEALTYEPSEASSDVDQSFTGEFPTKEEFCQYYEHFMKSGEDGRLPTPFLTVKGRTFEPWDLWEAVASQKMEPAERDWQQIAEKLGFDWVQHETVHDELRECYNKHLSQFEEFWNNFLAEEEEEEEEEEERSQDLGEPMPSSPPMISSLKRSLDAHQVSDHTYPHSSPKRRKLDKDAEVPSTPDEANGTSRLRLQNSTETTPSARRSTQRYTGNGDEDESRDTLNELPAIRRGRKKVLEPETQDFRFDPETQNIAFETQANVEIESQFSITPSQQLRQESDAVSPDIASASPTPKISNKNAVQGTPTPRRSIRNPFQEDSEGEPSAPATDSRTNQATTSTVTASKAKRRSLPASFSHKSSPVSGSTSVPPKTQAQSHAAESPRLVQRPIPVKETPDEVVDRFCSLGYPENIVLQALRATTWHLGDAGQVMEMLKRGEELPQRTRGVWTQRDDDSLKLVTSDEPPKDEKEERKRARAKKRLEAKHGTELMERRCMYLWGVV